MGGQVADYGEVLTTSGKVVARVIDVQNAPNGQHIHTVNVLCDFNLMDTVNLQVDISRHIAISKNHTATHMLDQSLRNIIGGDIHQAGSLVEPEYLRFDFTNEGPVSEENREKIETLMNH